MQFGRYNVVRMIGQGGMATVYEACEPRLNHRVAIKVMHAALAKSPELVARFEVEARIVNGIHHPGLVAVLDLNKLADGSVYLVMEFIEGETLAHRIAHRASCRLEFTEIYRLIRQTADTLGTVHESGIVHRDVKPENLMLVPDAFVAGGERVKLIDFGLAKVRNENHKPSTLDTKVGVGMGTVDYIAPEQILEARNTNDRADVYSLGCILFELAAGQRPFTGDNNMQIMGGHLTRPAPDVLEYSPELPPQLAVLLATMLAKEPQHRPNMRQVVRQLDTIWRAWVQQRSATVITTTESIPVVAAPRALPPRAPLRWRATLGLLTLGTMLACLPWVLVLQTCLPKSPPTARLNPKAQTHAVSPPPTPALAPALIPALTPADSSRSPSPGPPGPPGPPGQIYRRSTAGDFRESQKSGGSQLVARELGGRS